MTDPQPESQKVTEESRERFQLSDEAKMLASNWCYDVAAWRGRSPEFMQVQVGRLKKKLELFGQAAERSMAERAAQIATDYFLEGETKTRIAHHVGLLKAELLRALSSTLRG